jgi:hypothetical protein
MNNAMNNIKDALDRARAEVQDLHTRIDATTTRDRAALRSEVQESAARAQQLAKSLRGTFEGQRSEARKHIDDAAAYLEDAAKHARDGATATEARLREYNAMMLGRVRDAAESVSRAIASERANI